MAVMKKIAGLIAGASAVAVIGVAVAQGVPPNPFISNHALGAGQQSTHMTSMGETGVPGIVDQVQTAQTTVVEERQAIVEQPAPVVQEQQAMGAAPAPGPAPVEQPAAMPVAKADRG